MKVKWLRFKALCLGRLFYKIGIISRVTAFKWETELYVQD